MPASTCKFCGDSFAAVRAGAQYCSPAHRTAAYRARRILPPPAFWYDPARPTPKFSTKSRSLNADGSLALSNAELAEELVRVSDEGDDGKSKTGRRFFYLALSYGLIRPSMDDTPAAKKSRDAAYDRINDLLGRLRKNGQLDWTAVLDLTRELDEWQTYNSPREARAAMRRDYEEDRWLGQPYYPVLLVEKDTIEPVAKPIASNWQMPFASSRGYSSLKLQHDVAQMLTRRWAQHHQRGLIYFISDLDPSGLDLQRAWQEALDGFGARYRLIRIALTPAQVEALPDDMARLGIAVKPSDSRSKNYLANYGERCWEADILPASVIEQAIDDDIRSWLDVRRWQRRGAEIEEARQLL